MPKTTKNMNILEPSEENEKEYEIPELTGNMKKLSDLMLLIAEDGIVRPVFRNGKYEVGYINVAENGTPYLTCKTPHAKINLFPNNYYSEG